MNRKKIGFGVGVGMVLASIVCGLAITYLARNLKTEARFFTPTVAGHTEWVFSSKDFSQKEMETIMNFAPLDEVYSPLKTFGVGHGRSEDGDYPSFAKKIKKWIEEGNQDLCYLETVKIPKQLKPVIEYQKESVRFWIWKAECEYNYYTTLDIRSFERKYGEINPTIACNNILKKIEFEKDLIKRSELIAHDWGNCVIDEWHKKYKPEYPISAWKKFIKAYNIKKIAHYENNTDYN